MTIRRLRVRASSSKRELFIRRRSFAFIIFLAISMLAMMVLFTIFDNQRVQVDRVDISIPTMPRELNGYTILPISDLHGKIFENGQSGILRALGAAQFDCVVFLGDMPDSNADPAAFYSLIDALRPAGKPMYFTPGNHDPALYDLSNGEFKLSAFLQGALDRGVTLLDRPFKLRETTEGNLWLWPSDRFFTDAEAAIETAISNSAREKKKGTPQGDAEAARNELIIEAFTALTEARTEIKAEDIHIGASHYPITPTRMEILQDYAGPPPTLTDADLLLTGHYHAGQLRLPLIGAIKVPADDLSLGGWFPQQQEVSGLNKIGGTQQYISRGLGASGPLLLRFRLFNTPEISLLKLTSRVE